MIGICVADQPHILVVARTNAEICNTPRRSKQDHLVAVVLLCALAFFANLFRLYSRWHLNSRFDIDDWVMLGVAVLLVPFQVVGEYANYLAFGLDTWYVAPEDLNDGLKVRKPFAEGFHSGVRYTERSSSITTSARQSTWPSWA